jgi:hypothetical protein
MATSGGDIVRAARRHVGERYVFGALAPKNNAKWRGPWDCAEFTSWLVYQATGALYGCGSASSNPATADAWTGHWLHDGRKLGREIAVAEAAGIPGAFVLRHNDAGGHIVVSDGRGGTVEAHSTRTGVVERSLSGRRWDLAVLVPGITYAAQRKTDFAGPRATVYRLTRPLMTGPTVKALQRALKAAGFDPGRIDGEFGPMTAAAVRSYQAAHRLVADGEIGSQTARSLGVRLTP